MPRNTAFQPLTPKLLVQLAAPHTWPAALMPTLVGAALAVHAQSALSASVLLCIAVIVVLMQSAVNTLNDYFDFKKGADTAENQVDANDAVLVFNNVNPQQVKAYAVILVVLAFALGGYVIYRAGIVPLVLGVVGAVVLFLYSGGKTPISYLPIGEAVSGATMGTLIMLATYQALTGELSAFTALASLPLLIGIGLILMTNNTCDIEKDLEAKRRTFPALAGRARARHAYHVAFYLMVALICLYTLLFFFEGALFVPFFLLVLYPFGKALMANPLVLESRVAAMTQVLSVNVVCACFYAAIILAASPSCVLAL